MKELIVVFFVLLYTLTNAQNWCPQGATWTYGYFYSQGFSYKKLSYEKDTILGTQFCKKIGVQEISNYSNCLNTFDEQPIFTYAENDTVYFYLNNKFEPYLFFNAQVGDTFQLPNPFFGGGGCDTVLQFVVDSAGVMQINGETLRYYVAKAVGISSIKVIEKIGIVSNFFMIPFFTCNITDVDEYYPFCYEDSSFGTYQLSSNITCTCNHTSITDETITDNYINIFPNPANANINITLKHHDIHEVIFYNLHGQRKNVSVSNYSKEIQIDISSFPAGVYLLHLQFSEDKRAIYKIIKE